MRQPPRDILKVGVLHGISSHGRRHMTRSVFFEPLESRVMLSFIANVNFLTVMDLGGVV